MSSETTHQMLTPSKPTGIEGSVQMAKQHRHVIRRVHMVFVAERARERHGQIDHFRSFLHFHGRIGIVGVASIVRIVRIEHGQEVIQLGIHVLQDGRGCSGGRRRDRSFVLLVGEDLIDHVGIMLDALASTSLYRVFDVFLQIVREALVVIDESEHLEA